MTDLEYHQLAQAAARQAWEREPLPDRRQHFLRLMGEAQRRVEGAAFARPLVFAWGAAGYVFIGREGEDRPFLIPARLEGLDYAWRILLVGVEVHDMLDASMLLQSPGDAPGNALRGSLARAATWIEREARCPALAAALRRPALSISDHGRITLNPERIPPIRLFLPP